MKKNSPPNDMWYCVDCGINTYVGVVNYYMLTWDLWMKIGVGSKMLCIKCVERRLGRKLEKRDLLDCPLNTEINPYTMKILNS